MKVALVRCGETEENYLGKIVGRENVLLNDTGRRQVLKLKNKILLKKYDVCFISPQIRCFETAIALVGDRVEIIRDNDLIERDMGDLEGKEIVNYNAFNYWNYTKNISKEHVEPLKNLIDRTSNFLENIKEKNYNSVIIVVDVEVYRALRHLLLKGTLKGNMLDGYINNCSYEEFNI